MQTIRCHEHERNVSCGWVIQAGTDHAETTVFADEGLSDAHLVNDCGLYAAGVESVTHQRRCRCRRSPVVLECLRVTCVQDRSNSRFHGHKRSVQHGESTVGWFVLPAPIA